MIADGAKRGGVDGERSDKKKVECKEVEWREW